jgi:hypothetical protein
MSAFVEVSTLTRNSKDIASAKRTAANNLNYNSLGSCHRSKRARLTRSSHCGSRRYMRCSRPPCTLSWLAARPCRRLRVIADSLIDTGPVALRLARRIMVATILGERWRAGQNEQHNSTKYAS